MRVKVMESYYDRVEEKILSVGDEIQVEDARGKALADRKLVSEVQEYKNEGENKATERENLKEGTTEHKKKLKSLR